MNFALIGRIVLALIFVGAGIAHFPAYHALRDAMAARHVPAPGLSLWIGSLFQIGAGTCLMFAYATRWATIALIIFTIGASAMMLDFWNMQGMERERTLGAFMNNVALCGGLLIAGYAQY